jgi:hypothetical protein
MHVSLIAWQTLFLPSLFFENFSFSVNRCDKNAAYNKTGIASTHHATFTWKCRTLQINKLQAHREIQQQQQQPSLLVPSKLGYARDETT